jgi:hypothetical protein
MKLTRRRHDFSTMDSDSIPVPIPQRNTHHDDAIEFALRLIATESPEGRVFFFDYSGWDDGCTCGAKWFADLDDMLDWAYYWRDEVPPTKDLETMAQVERDQTDGEVLLIAFAEGHFVNAWLVPRQASVAQ